MIKGWLKLLVEAKELQEEWRKNPKTMDSIYNMNNFIGLANKVEEDWIIEGNLENSEVQNTLTLMHINYWNDLEHYYLNRVITNGNVKKIESYLLKKYDFQSISLYEESIIDGKRETRILKNYLTRREYSLEDFIWIPTIKQLTKLLSEFYKNDLEMLQALMQFVQDKSEMFKEYDFIALQNGNDMFTMLLAFYMNKKYSKIWENETWVNENE